LTEQRRIKAEQKDTVFQIIQTVTVKFTAYSGFERIHFTSYKSCEVLLLLLQGCGRVVDPIAGGGVAAQENPAASSAGAFYKVKPFFYLHRDH
jgi:hypothetical protein